MPSVKSKWLKPSRNVPYAEGILVYNDNGSEIPKNSLVMIKSGALQGGGLKITAASAGTATGGGKVPLFVTKHGIPDGKWGVILPWSVVLLADTSAVTTEGDVVYLQDAGGWGSGAGTVSRAVGVCIAKHASTGVVWLCPSQFSYETV